MRLPSPHGWVHGVSQQGASGSNVGCKQWFYVQTLAPRHELCITAKCAPRTHPWGLEPRIHASYIYGTTVKKGDISPIRKKQKSPA